MARIALIDFVDFVSKTGTPKLTFVRTLHKRSDYDPKTDFWKPLRDAIVAFHTGRHTDKKWLDSVVSGVSSRKTERYRSCVRGYKRFLGAKKPKWFRPPSSSWKAHDLEIRVNPELGLTFSGTHHIIKLYFKKEKIEKRRVDALHLLMKEALTSKRKPANAEYGILDVPRGKLFSTPSPNPDLLPLLIGEAASFQAIWDQL